MTDDSLAVGSLVQVVGDLVIRMFRGRAPGVSYLLFLPDRSSLDVLVLVFHACKFATNLQFVF